jgi:hypothetical protein
MSEPTQSAGGGPRDRVALAIVLIVIGLGSLVAQVVQPTEAVGGWIVLLIGLGLLGAFAYTRLYGYLIPGGIMAGLGGGIIASFTLDLTGQQTGGAIVLGLGLGFLSIWVIGSILRLAENHWWPLIPGGILAVVGSVLLIGGEAVNILDYWGLVIVAIGLLVLWRAWSDMRASR